MALISRPSHYIYIYIYIYICHFLNSHIGLIDFEFAGRNRGTQGLWKMIELAHFLWGYRLNSLTNTLVRIVYITSDTKSILLQGKKTTTNKPLNKYSMKLWFPQIRPRERKTVTSRNWQEPKLRDEISFMMFKLWVTGTVSSTKPHIHTFTGSKLSSPVQFPSTFLANFTSERSSTFPSSYQYNIEECWKNTVLICWPPGRIIKS